MKLCKNYKQYNVKHNKTITKTEKNLNKITQKYDEAEYFLYILWKTNISLQLYYRQEQCNGNVKNNF